MFLAQFLAVATIHFLAVASPGPDFLIVSKNSVSHSRKIGILTALGVALGIGVHVTYCLFGIAIVISQSILLFNTFKYIGAAYLIWIGYKGLRSRAKANSGIEVSEVAEKKKLSSFGAVKMGFLVNVLNPKATLFFLALFTQVIDPSTPKWIEILFGIEMVTATFVWFTIVSVVFSNRLMKTKLNRYGHWLDRVAGAMLLALGIKVALSSQK
ncbi:MAG: LysE family transporter [Candidatus Paceibacterota bacterium]|jgi:RhtB (resistance to homoserine/threonine) family protein